MLDPIEAIGAIAGYLGAFEWLLRAICYVVGIVLVLQSLRLAAKRSEFGAQSASAGRIAVSFVIGTGMLAFPATVSLLLATVFGSTEIADPDSVFALDGGMLDPLSGGSSREAVRALILIIQFIGFIAIARGLLFLNLATRPDGPRTLGPGFTFLIAGALAVNFPAFFGLVADLFSGRAN